MFNGGFRINEVLKTDVRDRANARPFQSKFTLENYSDFTLKGESPFSVMEDITVDPSGVTTATEIEH